MSQLKFSHEHGYKKSQEVGVRGTKRWHGWSNRAQRPRYEAITDETHLSLGCLVAEAQKVWFIQALAPEACTSRDVHSPRPLRKTHKMRAGSSPQPCSIMISRTVLTQKKEEKKARQKWGKWQKWGNPLSSHWIHGTQGAVVVSISCQCSLNSPADVLRVRRALLFFKAWIPPCSPSVTFLKERLYEHNDEYYHPGYLPDSSSLIVL